MSQLGEEVKGLDQPQLQKDEVEVLHLSQKVHFLKEYEQSISDRSGCKGNSVWHAVQTDRM